MIVEEPIEIEEALMNQVYKLYLRRDTVKKVVCHALEHNLSCDYLAEVLSGQMVKVL
jgi:hypothetical protein